MKNIVLIPAYQPDEKLIHLVEELSSGELGIMIVNDGSGPEYASVFDAVSDRAEIVNLPCNSGKGFALKSGIATIINNHPECEHFVTADSDGQHKSDDILRVFDELEKGAEFVLTVRKFRGNMPFRSKLGNNLSRYIYTILNGHYLLDNQSGLRGFSAKHSEWLVRVDGNKYDYEMNVLYYADKQGVTITTIPVEAIYIDNNSSSHFHPIKDTLRIYAQLFYSARVTFAALLIVQQLLLVTTFFLNYRFLHITIPTIGATATVFNIVMNRFVVFRKFKYQDLMRTVIYSLIRYIAYSMIVLSVSRNIPSVPLFISFNFALIVMIPVEYMFHKFIYIAKYSDINKER